jgi:hypothetical protein
VALLQFMERYNMKITETIFDIVTQETTIVEHELTAQDIAEREAAAAAQAEREAEQAAKDAAKQAVLDKLGLSADEVAALLS